MKKFTKWVLMLVALSLFAPAAWAEVETEGYASVDIFSNYVWRGQKLSEEWVIQPAVGIVYGGFGAYLWANYDTDTQEHNETDLALYYSHAVDKLSIEGGYVYYALDGYEDTQEVYLAVGYDTLLNPSATFFYDVDQGDGGFLVVAVGHSIDLPREMALNLGVSVGINFENEIMGLDEEGDPFTDFYNGEVSISLTIPLHEHVTIQPVAAYTFPLTDDAEEAIESISYDEDSSIFYGGVNFLLSF